VATEALSEDAMAGTRTLVGLSVVLVLGFGLRIVSVPAKSRRMDRSLTIQLSAQLRVIGFGPDSV